MQNIRIDLPSRGGAVHALAFGSPERPVDVVFLHANGFNARTYRSILAPLGDDLRVIAFDQRGHGLTELPAPIEGRRDWFDLRDDLIAVLEAADARDVVLSGHSMGGTACVLAAVAAPERVKSLVLFDPVILPASDVGDSRNSPMVEGALRRRPRFPDRQAAMKAYKGRGAFSTWPDVMLEDYLVDGLAPDGSGELALTCTPAWEASGYASHEHDGYAHLERLSRPTTVHKAEAASTCRLETIPRTPGGLSVEVVPGTTHFLPMERPDLVRSALCAASRKPVPG